MNASRTGIVYPLVQLSITIVVITKLFISNSLIVFTQHEYDKWTSYQKIKSDIFFIFFLKINFAGLVELSSFFSVSGHVLITMVLYFLHHMKLMV